MNSKTIAILLGLSSALFFATTFVLNRVMAVAGGSWIWSASLRFFWMVPLLLIPLLYKRQFSSLWNEIKKQPFAWLLWSTVGFGLFYAPLTFSAAFAPSWLVASTWQFTIVAGLLVAPWLTKGTQRKGISIKALGFSLLILLGIALMQKSQFGVLPWRELLLGGVPVLVAAFAYPIGNRKMMQLTNGRLTPLQRTFGMTLMSLPFWGVLGLFGLITVPLPDAGQLSQTFIVAICSGVIATTLFFAATDRVRHDEKALASVEATQSAEVIFALLGELLLLHIVLPDATALFGIGLVILGMTLHSLKS